MSRRPLHELLNARGIQPLHVPKSWKNAAFLEQNVYYIIPLSLWESVVLNVGRERFTEDDQRREREIAEAARDDSGNVAIRNDAFVNYLDLLPIQPVILNPEAADVLGKKPAQARQLARAATERLAETDGPRRAYLGWLLTNPQFLQEHEDLHSQFANQLEGQGYPQPRQSSCRLPDKLIVDSERWIDGCREFYVRWRLQSLILPHLPVPLPFQVPMIEDPASGKTVKGVVTSSIPDIYPARGRGLIDATMEDALRGRGAPEHLQEWFQIVRRSSAKANVLPMYGRWFRLQHYWRLLHRRYPEPLDRKKRVLIEVFATFFAIGGDTIKSDLRRIEDRLSSGWERR